MTKEFLKALGPLYVVNLPCRTDRHAEFCEQLSQIGIDPDDPKVQFFPAIRPDNAGEFTSAGARGCFLSHMKVVEMALSHPGADVIICEDDLDFAANFASRSPGVLQVLDKTDWDIFIGGYVSDAIGEIVSRDPLVFRVPPEQELIGSHFYILRNRAIPRLHRFLQAMNARPAGHPEGGPMHYDGALNHFRAQEPDIVTLTTLPAMGVQRPSRTDVHELAWFDRVPLTRPIMAGLRRLKRMLSR